MSGSLVPSVFFHLICTVRVLRHHVKPGRLAQFWGSHTPVLLFQDLKTSRGLHEEMKKAARSNAKQVPQPAIDLSIIFFTTRKEKSN